MALMIHTLVLGPLENNTYMLADDASGAAVVIDPSFGIQTAVFALQRHGYHLSAIWLTHAHFDHIAGVKALLAAAGDSIPVGLHPADLPLWNRSGDSGVFGFQLKAGPEPQMHFEHGQILQLGAAQIEVRHTPGHAPGHVVFYCAEAGAALCGDVIFYRGIGRTDLPGGDEQTLLASIRSQILTLPPDTRLLSGHGPETTIAAEKEHNPYLVG